MLDLPPSPALLQVRSVYDAPMKACPEVLLCGLAAVHAHWGVPEREAFQVRRRLGNAYFFSYGVKQPWWWRSSCGGGGSGGGNIALCGALVAAAQYGGCIDRCDALDRVKICFSRCPQALLPTYLVNNPNTAPVLHRLWATSQRLLLSALVDWYGQVRPVADSL